MATTNKNNSSKKSASQKTPAKKPAPRHAKKESGPDPEVYNDIVRCAQLREVILTESKFNMKSQAFRIRDKNLAGDFNITEIKEERDYDSEVGLASGQHRWCIEVKVGRSKPLKLEASFLVIYTDLENKDRDTVLFFLDRVVRFTAYPYLRQLVSNYSWMSGVDLPILPVISNK